VRDISQFQKLLNCWKWLPVSLWQQATARFQNPRVHLVVALADHFEPAVSHGPERFVSRAEQENRLKIWCHDYPAALDRFLDSDGFPFRHTYFWPAEQYDPDLVQRLAEHCHSGWGEIEIHLHHGVGSPDNAEHTRLVLENFRDALAHKHRCLSTIANSATPRYAFVHGNWALANSAGNRNCGVDNELQILADTGCYADFTLPSAPNRAQVRKINSVYECNEPIGRRAAHSSGKNLRVGSSPRVFPLIIQGPLLLAWHTARKRPYIENSAVANQMETTMERLVLWERAAIAVRGRPEWLFIKLHCHGMDPEDRDAMMGPPMQQFLRSLTDSSKNNGYGLHFVTPL